MDSHNATHDATSARQAPRARHARAVVSPARLRRARLAVSATFLLVGTLSATWAARVPAVKDDLGLSNGQLAVVFTGLEAGALVGLQIGGALVPRTGSRAALVVSLPAYIVLLSGPALAGNLVTLTAAVFVWAAVNSVVDVAMNAHGVAVEQHSGQPILSGLHAMHPLGGLLGAGVAALAAGRGVGRTAHFLAAAIVLTLAAVAASRLLLPSSVDASPATSQAGGGRSTAKAALVGWLGGWSGRILLLGALAFAVELAQSGGTYWGAIYLRDGLGTSTSAAAAGVAVFLAAMLAGRLAGDRLRGRLGPLRLFRAGALVAGAGFGGALLLDTPLAGMIGLALLGGGVSILLPLAISAAGNLDGKTAAAVARVSTLGYLGSFVGPALVGSIAAALSLPVALGLPALAAATAALGARGVVPAGRHGDAPASTSRADGPWA